VPFRKKRSSPLCRKDRITRASVTRNASRCKTLNVEGNRRADGTVIEDQAACRSVRLTVRLAGAFRKASTPKFGIACSVKHRNYEKTLGARNIENTVREAANQNAPQAAIDRGVQQRIFLDRRKCTVEGCPKLQT
jgi:hypothetical protein